VRCRPRAVGKPAAVAKYSNLVGLVSDGNN